MEQTPAREKVKERQMAPPPARVSGLQREAVRRVARPGSALEYRKSQQTPARAAHKHPFIRHERATPRKVESHPLATPDHKRRQAVEERITREALRDRRFQRELKELSETEDLRQVDDDVEAAATLYEWQADEHTHQDKTARWYMALAGGVTVAAGLAVVMGNILGAITILLAGGLTYYVAQQQPRLMRYRLLVDGIAINDTLYHYRDIRAFNIVYEPGEVKTAIFHINRRLSPLVHMEIGEADPLVIRDILLEFAKEDLDLEEPIVDIWARRLGF